MKAPLDEDKQVVEGIVIDVAGPVAWLETGEDAICFVPASEVEDVGINERIQLRLRSTDPDGLRLYTVRMNDEPVDIWEYLLNAHETGAPIRAYVTGFQSGGLTVDVGVSAFLPASRAGAGGEMEVRDLLGVNVICQVIELDPASRNVVLDRRKLLDLVDSWTEMRAIRELKEGSIVSGTVCSLTAFGAFLDLGGIDGLLHVKEISWRRVERLSDVLSIGQQVKVLIQKVDQKNRRVALSMRALEPNPWIGAADRYKVGTQVRGEVTTVTDFGAFVEVEAGLEGLIHQNDLSWLRHPPIPADVLKLGQQVDAVVLFVNEQERKLSLSRRAAVRNPWEDAERLFPRDTLVQGRVTTLAEFGAFVQVTPDLEGLIHVTDLRDGRTEHPADVIAVGQMVTAQVLEVDTARRRLHLGIKQLASSVLQESSRETEAGSEPAAHIQSAVRTPAVLLGFGEGRSDSPIAEAVAFAILNWPLSVRLVKHGETPANWTAALRDCDYAVFGQSETFGIGLSLGCIASGAVDFRGKQMLAFAGSEFPGAEWCVSAKSPVEAVRIVYDWLTKQGVPERSMELGLSRYLEFREALPELCAEAGFVRNSLSLDQYMALAQKWLSIPGCG